MKNKLIERLESEYRTALNHYRFTRSKRIEGKELCKLMPLELTEADIDWYLFQKQGDKEWYLETYGMGENEANEIIKTLRRLGVYGMKPEYRKWNNTWAYNCEMMCGDAHLTIKIDGGSKPPSCRIEESKETREVIVYKAICPETGNEL